MTNDLHNLLARVEADVPYAVGPNCYLIPWADLSAAGAYEALSGSATTSATTADAMRQIHRQALTFRSAFGLTEASPGPRKDGSALLIQTPNQEGEGS